MDFLEYYCKFGCPDLADITPQWELCHDPIREWVEITYLNGTDFTREEYAQLEKGYEEFETFLERFQKWDQIAQDNFIARLKEV